MRLLPSYHIPARSGRLVENLSPMVFECEQWVPDSDVAETSDRYVVTMEMPGIDRNSLDVTFQDGLLTVKGEKLKEEQEGECCLCSERYSGPFERSFRIAGNVKGENIEALYRDGILKLTLPKSEETPVKKIEIH